MKCPYCGYTENRVLDTRIHKDGEIIRRRRECEKCKDRFSTQEVLFQVYPLVIKKDGRREPYSKEKVLNGVQAACQKRPVSLAQMEQIVERISKWILDHYEKELSAQIIGEQLMKELRVVDDVAYVRFASVYRTFKDISEFVETLEEDTNEAPFVLTPPPSN